MRKNTGNIKSRFAVHEILAEVLVEIIKIDSLICVSNENTIDDCYSSPIYTHKTRVRASSMHD